MKSASYLDTSSFSAWRNSFVNQIPISAYFLVKFKLSIYASVIVIYWGITLACMAAARTFSGLSISRIFVSPTTHCADRPLYIQIHTRHFREPLKQNLHSKFSGLPVRAGKEEDDKRVDEKVA